MGRALTILLILHSTMLFGFDYYRSNSIWMPLEQVGELPQQGYALELRSGEHKGYLDGTLMFRRTEQLSPETLEITEEHLDTDTVHTRVYQRGKLIEEHRSVGTEEQRILYQYGSTGEIEEVLQYQDDSLDYLLLPFYNQDGALRSIYRFRHQQLLQRLHISEGGFSVGTDERMVREQREGSSMTREYITDGEVVFRMVETRDGEHVKIEQTRFNPYLKELREYQDDLLMLEKWITDGGTRETIYRYDGEHRLISEMTETSLDGRRRQERILYTYDEHTGVLLEQMSEVNGELREIQFYREDGSRSAREVYRGGVKLLRYTYE